MRLPFITIFAIIELAIAMRWLPVAVVGLCLLAMLYGFRRGRVSCSNAN